jgi:NitT/TauT family transport system permease protein
LPQEVSGKKMDKKKAIFIALVITVIVLVVPLTIIISRGTSSNAALTWNIGSIGLTDLLTDSMSSIYRMFVALALSFIVAIIVGITAARKPLASRIIIPIVDILQSVPILGFFPAAIAFFITLFSGSPIGVELAAIFLIFTSMVWNMIFAVYESVLSIPPELIETSKSCRANPLLQFRRLYLPASIPKLIYNSILSWAAGWYFLTAAEIISVGSNTFTLPGLGSLLSKSVASGQYIEALVAITVLILIIMLTDFFIWRPLESYSNRFRYDYSTSPPDLARRHIMQDSNNNIARLFLRRVAFQPIQLRIINPRPLIHIKSNLLIRTLGKLVSAFEFRIFPTVHHWFDNKRNFRLFVSITLSVLTMSAILVIVLEGGVIYKSLSALSNMYFSLYKDPRSAKIVSQIPLALLLSYLRLASAYLITLAWTIPVAIKIAHNPNFERIMPLFQTFAAIPATAFFPFMAILVAYIPGGLEFPSILLILTGMQWYILFNLIGGVRSISGDIEEAAKALRADKGQYIRRVLFPSIYPSFITGSITGWGGGWNSLIVAEFLIYGNKTYSVLGIGSLLDKAAYTLGNTVLLFLIVGVMIAVIIAINRLVWRRLYRKVIRKYSMSS